MGKQMIVILELCERRALSVTATQDIAAVLLGTKGKTGELRLQRSVEGEVTPRVAYQLTDTGATFTLSGSSNRVYDTLWHLCQEDFGPGTRITIDARNALVIKHCAEIPDANRSRPASKEAGSDAGAFNHALDAVVKMVSLTAQSLSST